MEKHVQELLTHAKKRSDSLMDYFLIGYFAIGLLLAFYYDTWLIATGVGGLCLIAYYSAKFLLPDSNCYQYVLGAVVGIFMAQYIYQMHGMFEMHFFAFIGSAILIIYRNWKLQLPLAMVVLIHHAAFGYLQFVGFDKIYFTQLEYMSMQTFAIHILLATTIFSLCAVWANSFKRYGDKFIKQSFEIGRLREAGRQNDVLTAMTEDLRVSNEQLTAAHKELQTIFNRVEDVLFSMDMKANRLIQISRSCESVYGYSAEEFIADNDLWKKLIHPADKMIIKVIDRKLQKGQTAFIHYRIIDKYNNTHWIEMKMIPTLDGNNELVRVDGICNNITQKVALENKLAEENDTKRQEITAAVITAQENERYFLGQELHDNINPILATAKLYIDCVMGNGENKAALLKDSKGFITTAMNEIRTLSKSLVPPSLGEIGLTDAMADMVEHIKAVNTLRFICNWNGFDESELTDQLKLTIYRILQEQLNNILKHSKAHSVCITLQQKGAVIELVIKDDGVGFDTRQKRNGVGLQNICSRTELFNGTVQITAAPGKGCQLTVQFNTQAQVTELQADIRA